jgi:AraC-like DNA-binding protein
MAELLMARPADKASVGKWAKQVGMSERTMSRLLAKEIGMSFGSWRRQLHVILAIQRLNRGERVQAVALRLGYEDASSFVTMFRKMVGKPPAQYLSSCVANLEGEGQLVEQKARGMTLRRDNAL